MLRIGATNDPLIDYEHCSLALANHALDQKIRDEDVNLQGSVEHPDGRRVASVCKLAALLRERYLERRDVQDIRRAIQLFTTSISNGVLFERVDDRILHCSCCRLLAEHNEDPTLTDQALQVYQQVSQLSTELTKSQHHRILTEGSRILRIRAMLDLDPAALQESITLQRRALVELDGSLDEMSDRLYNLAVCLCQLDRLLREDSDQKILIEAADIAAKAFECATTVQEKSRSARVLAIIWFAGMKYSDDGATVLKVINQLQKAAKFKTPDSWHLMMVYRELAGWSVERAETTHKFEDMQLAKAAAAHAVGYTDPTNATWTRRARLLLLILKRLYKTLGLSIDKDGNRSNAAWELGLERGVPEVHTTVVQELDAIIEKLTKGAFDVAKHFNDLSRTRYHDFVHASRLGNLELAIHHAQMAILFSPHNSVPRAKYLSRYAAVLMVKSKWSNEMDLIRACFKLGEDAIYMLQGRDTLAEHECWERYSRHCLDAYYATNASGFLDDAIRLARVSVLSASRPVLDCSKCTDLPRKLTAEDILDPETLENEFVWTALRSHLAINTTAEALIQRYMRKKDEADLDIAHRLATYNMGVCDVLDWDGRWLKAIAVKTMGDTNYAKFLSLKSRDTATALEFFSEGRELGEVAPGLVAPTNRQRAALHLAHAVRSSEFFAFCKQDMAQEQRKVFLDDNMQLLEQIVESINSTQEYKEWHMVKSITAPTRLDTVPKENDTTTPIPTSDVTWLSYVEIPMRTLHHPVYHEAAVELAVHLMMRNWEYPSPSDLERALQLLDTVSKPVTGVFADESSQKAFLKANAAIYAAHILTEQERYGDAYVRVKWAVHHISGLEFATLTLSDQTFVSSAFAELPALATALALESDQNPIEALKISELTRGRLISFALDLRANASNIEAYLAKLRVDGREIEDPDDVSILDNLTQLTKFTRQNAAQASIRFTPQLIDGELRAYRWSDCAKQFTLTKEFATVLDTVQQWDTDKNFRGPESIHHLIAISENGPIISFNVGTWRSDALVLMNKTPYITFLPLPDLRLEDVETKSKQLSGAQAIFLGTMETETERNETLTSILGWLWDVAVQPILSHLKLITNDQTGRLPHVWWLNSGIMSSMPFHAAGRHGPNCTSNTMSHVVSSYTATLKQLLFSQKQTAETHCDSAELLLASMPQTHQMNPLPNAAKEALSIERLWSGRVKPLTKPAASEIMKALPSANAVHFICHGLADPNTPDRSHLIFDNNSHSSSASVNVGDIATLMNSSAQLAYLSACSTADSGAATFINEFLNIASAFQMVGFPHVIATLWPADDEFSSLIAEAFYRNLAQLSEKDGVRGTEHKILDSKQIREALHLAILECKNAEDDFDAYWTKPLLWAPFVHFGA